MIFGWLRWLVLPAATALFLLTAERAGAEETRPSFFNSTETISTNLKPFNKWTDAVARFSKEEAEKIKGDCKSTKLNKCHYKEWMGFLESLKDKDDMTRLNEVNRVMNKAAYIIDKANWGVEDYWATPNEFLERFGDCEDYAIAKYISLKHLGFKVEQLRVAAVKDMNLKVGHAVLIVYLNSKIYLLDNQIKQVVEAGSVYHYSPVYSINENNWWRHNPKTP